MMLTFALDYYILVVVAAFGAIQIAASVSQLKGLLLFKSIRAARTVGLALVVGAFVWFFASESRNINDYEGGLDGNAQAVYFLLGAATAVLATIVVSSLLNAGMNGGEPAPGEGLDALRHTNFVRALAHSIRYWWKEWRTQMRSYFSG